VGCTASTPTQDPTPSIQPEASIAGLHNVHRLSDRIISGSSPEGDAGFASLKLLGVKTILSVDGATPDVTLAEKHGLRYVHVPIGYDGVPDGKAYLMARVVRDLPGPVYVHCHHGKHRGPAAAAAVRLCLDPAFTPEAAEAWLKQAGTDPKYRGLMGLPKALKRPTAAELDRVPAEFPPVAKVEDLTRMMVAVDERWEHLKAVQAAGWAVPRAHPDVDPPHEALQLRELYREAGRLPQTGKHGDEIRRWLGEAEAAAGDLEAALRASPVDAAKAKAAFEASRSLCARCHEKYRD
jgi:hypothetical protein